jgi:hypothetical protein
MGGGCLLQLGQHGDGLMLKPKAEDETPKIMCPEALSSELCELLPRKKSGLPSRGPDAWRSSTYFSKSQNSRGDQIVHTQPECNRHVLTSFNPSYLASCFFSLGPTYGPLAACFLFAMRPQTAPA